MNGVLGLDYAQQRVRRRALKYRLRRRADEAIRAIGTHFPNPDSILDLGTADGRMFAIIQSAYPSARCIGIEYSPELLALGTSLNPGITFIRGDAQSLPFLRDASFSVIVAAALIEHLQDSRKMLEESRRILKTGGILIITTPHPFWEKIAGRLGMIKGEHSSVMSFRELRLRSRSAGLEVLEERGFMISPVGFPGERSVEGILRWLRIDRILANQLMVLRKPTGQVIREGK